MKTIGNIDKQIAGFYAPLFLEGVSYGESQLNIWVAGAGKTVIIPDIISIKSPNIKFVFYSCDKTENATAKEILVNIGASLKLSENELKSNRLLSIISDKCNKIALIHNKSVVFVGNKYENLTEKELAKLLNFISQIVSTNKRKIHSIINCIDKPLIEKLLSKNPSIFTIANRIKFMPVISGSILENYIKEKSLNFGKKIPEEKINEVINTTGGILFLTKEIIRSYPESGELDVKFKSVWNQLPKAYQDSIKSQIPNPKFKNELAKLGILNLNIFNQKNLLTEKNPLKFVNEILEGKDKKIFSTFINSKNKLISKDQIAEIIWGENYDEFYSDWTIDQTVSRFRKKIEKLGITPEALTTIKGKGYKWKF